MLLYRWLSSAKLGETWKVSSVTLCMVIVRPNSTIGNDTIRQYEDSVNQKNHRQRQRLPFMSRLLINRSITNWAISEPEQSAN